MPCSSDDLVISCQM